MKNLKLLRSSVTPRPPWARTPSSRGRWVGEKAFGEDGAACPEAEGVKRREARDSVLRARMLRMVLDTPRTPFRIEMQVKKKGRHNWRPFHREDRVG
jgi:hypothetical protein